MMFRSLVLSCSLLGFLVGGALMAMGDDDRDESSLFNQLPTYEKATILEFAAFDAGKEKKDLSKLALVCKHWNDFVTKEQHRIKKSWLRGLYNIIDPKEVEIFEQFYNGKLIYRPDPESDEGMVTLSISALKNPLEDTFDLSNCGDTEKYLSIATGYRKGMISSNSEKGEIWFTPRFLIKRELETTAAHFKPIMDIWKEEQAPVGMFFTWGGWDDLGWYDYLTTESMESLGSGNLFEKYSAAGLVAGGIRGMRHARSFHISFVN